MISNLPCAPEPEQPPAAGSISMAAPALRHSGAKLSVVVEEPKAAAAAASSSRPRVIPHASPSPSPPAPARGSRMHPAPRWASAPSSGTSHVAG
ncbi:hypothetical protein GUJ93_ZPchr0013g34511 [Zizania palustris]|uniref:Uncharacterized protein n=1 Tax=Zizania palustris TaxID=103762 RepID=A0A8J5WUC7_ZIZPA|nr:hypothetical protein GUJ93_ZPchr0013g34511 [Zizania palustris]